MRFLTLKRLKTAAVVAAVLGAIAVLGAFSRASSTAGSTGVAVTTAGAGAVPTALWYWTMAVSPSDPKVLVLGTSSGLYRSTDGGRTWKTTGPKGLDATSVALTGKTLLAGGVTLKPTDSPVVRKGAARSAPDGAGVLAASTDDGATWTVMHPKGLPNLALQSLAVDPANASDVYAFTTTGKLYRSTDGAASFTLVSPKIGIPPWALAVTKGTHFLAGDMDTGNYLSNDGKKWQKARFTDGRGTKMIMEYALKPTDPTEVLMSSFGLEVSNDSGKTWHTVLKSSVMFGPVAWASSSPSTAYAVGFDSSLWRTDDSGKTWKKVS